MGFLLQMTNSNLSIIMVVVCFVPEILISLFFSYVSTRLNANNISVADAVASCDWFNQTPEVRKILLLIMMNGQKTRCISATSISDISLNSYARVGIELEDSRRNSLQRIILSDEH